MKKNIKNGLDFKKRIKQLTNSKWKKILIMFVCVIVLNSLLTFTAGINVIEAGLRLLLSGNIDNVIYFESDGYSSNEPGSWHITKSAEWIDIGKAQITFEVDSIAKIGDTNKDIILVLDISESMKGEKLEKVKEDAKELVDVVLSNPQNRIALISFHSSAQILSEFTNDKDQIISLIEGLIPEEATNYADALKKVGDVLVNYNKTEDTDLLVLFLSDGYPSEDTPNQIGEAAILKDNYPYLIINGIQYEMGNRIIEQLKEISDNQYLAYVENLQNILFEAAGATKYYEKFIVNDFIDERYFELGTIENVQVSNGDATLSIEDGMEKVTWDLGQDYRTGARETMTIEVELKNDVSVNESSIFSTNRKEYAETKLPEEQEKLVKSSDTPKLRGTFKVYYDANAPMGCSIVNQVSDSFRAFEKVTIKGDDLSNKCGGYLFKGWEMTDDSSDGIGKVTDDTFIMPGKDVTIKGTWTKVAISKSMTAEEYQMKYILPFNGEEGYLDNTTSEFVVSETGINFKSYASDTNGKGLYVRAGTEGDEYPIFYYRGDITNNNVLFANKCWQIVRTTETGGTKLIYNGLPDSDGTCERDSSKKGQDRVITSIVFGSNVYSLLEGYMVGTSYDFRTDSNTTYSMLSRELPANSNDYYYSKTYNKVGNNYVLGDDAQQFGSWLPNYSDFANEGYYTCKSSTSPTDSCSKLFYLVGATQVVDKVYAFWLVLEDGQSIDEVNLEMKFASDIKDNGDGTYSLIDPVTMKKTDWLLNYDRYKNYYYCSDYVSTTCDSVYLITDVTDYSFQSIKAGNFKYANDVSWNGTSYELKDNNIVQFKTGPWATNYNKFNNNHYTCLTNGTVCTRVYYIHYTSKTSIYYTELTGGKKVEDILKEMLPTDNDVVNQKDSPIKNYIENTWFAGADGLVSYDDYLEDTVWCNDRSIGDLAGWNPNGGDTTSYVSYSFKSIRYNLSQPSLVCNNLNDSFTVSEENGNGKLKYKVGLITADEGVLGGLAWGGNLSSKSYLNIGTHYWTFTNSEFHYDGVYMADVYSINSISYLIGYNYRVASYVRPSISLKAGIINTDPYADGSPEHPYRIE